MGVFYKMPEKKEIILDTDYFYKNCTRFQLEALVVESRLELEKMIKKEGEDEWEYIQMNMHLEKIKKKKFL